MSRPRKPFGNPPGRLPATMIKVLAAEMSDQGRLQRGKRYWADSAVVDIVVGHGAVTAEIQGSRPMPYVVTIEATPGAGVPGKREVWVRCTCPDDAGTGVEACKHAVAAFFALSDEVAIDPDLLDRWRGGSGERPARHGPDTRDHPSAPPAPAAPTQIAPTTPASAVPPSSVPGHVRPSNVIPIRRDRPVVDPEPDLHDPTVDEIARLLAAPDGARPPELPEVDRIEHGTIREPSLAEVLDDVLDHLHIQWD